VSRENLEIVRKLCESQGSDFYDLLDPHVVWLNYGSAPEPGPYLGHDGVHEWAKGWRATFGTLRFTRLRSSTRAALEAAGLRKYGSRDASGREGGASP
jgi:hypothetical protein